METKDKIDYLAGGALAARGGTYLPSSNEINISYIYNKNKGGGHRSLANNYKKLLESKGYKTTLSESTSPKSVGKALFSAPRYAAGLDTGRGIPFLQDRQINSPGFDYSPNQSLVLPFHTSSKDIEYRRGSLAKELGLPQKKIVTLSAGESGSFLEDKFKITQDALKNRKDVSYVILGGNRADEIKKTFGNQKNVIVKGFMDSKDFQRYLSTSDLNIGYTGSSSIAEQASSRNPSVILSTLNKKNSETLAGKNLEYASKKGIPTFTRAESKEFKSTINNLLDNPDLKAIADRQKSYVGEVQKSQDAFLKNTKKAVNRGNLLRRIRGAGLIGAGGYVALNDKFSLSDVSQSAIAAAGGAFAGTGAVGALRLSGKDLKPSPRSLLVGGTTVLSGSSPIIYNANKAKDKA